MSRAARALALCVLLSACGLAAPTPSNPPPLTHRAEEPAPVPVSAEPAPVETAPRDAGGALVLASGVTLPLRGRRPDGGYVVLTPCAHEAIASEGRVVRSTHVVIDPGHGGKQPGAVGPNGLVEKQVNLAVSRRLAGELSERGYSSVLTRTGDYRVALAARAAFAQTLRPRVFLSVHFNAEPDELRQTPGSETYYQHRSPDSRRLAGVVYEEIYRALSAHPITWAADRDAGVKPRLNEAGEDYYAVLRMTEGTTSVLTESAYVVNPPEERLIADPAVQQSLAEAMARGVHRFLTTNDPGSGYVDPYPRDASLPTGRSDASCQDPELGLREAPEHG